MIRTGQLSSFWYSRTKLAASSVVLVFLIGLLDQRSRCLPKDEFRIKTTTQKPDNLLIDVDYATEAMDYMYNLPLGKSYIRGVVEDEQPVIEYYWWCSLEKPQIIAENGWISNDDVHIFSAYYDDRPNSLFPKNDAIQVLAMSYRTLENRTKVYCNIGSENRYAHVEAYVREIWQRAWDPRDHFYVPNLITCPIPNRFKNAENMTISITTRQCTGQNMAFKVVKKEKKKEKMVAVCVKGMDFQDDISTRFVEWMEAQLLFGADDVTIYTYSVSNRTKSAFKYYEKLGKLETIPIDLPGDSPNIPYIRSGYIWRNRQQKRRHELIPYNDCLYRHINTHRYILILDTDEVIVPMKSRSYPEMLLSLENLYEKKVVSSFSVRNVFKFPSISPDLSEPDYMYFLQNNLRSRETSGIGEYGKSFTRISNVGTVFNHFALHRMHKKVSASVYVHESEAVKLHYKEKCPIESKAKCPQLENDQVIDKSLDGIKDGIKKRVKNTLDELGFL